MADRRAVLLGAALVTVLMVLSSMGLLAAYQSAPGLAGVHASSTVGTAAPAVGTARSASGTNPLQLPAAHSAPTPGLRSNSAVVSNPNVPYGIAQAEQDIDSGQINPASVLLPHAPTGSVGAPNGPITGPSYPSLPAPMGLSDLGQGGTGPVPGTTPPAL